MINEQRLHELEELRRQAREIKLHRLTEEEGDFLRALHYKSAGELTRDDESRLRTLVRQHWRRDDA